MTRWEELRGMTISNLTDLVLEKEAEVERLTELIKQMQVMGRAVDNIAAAALESKA
jgi:hypothetical protein